MFSPFSNWKKGARQILFFYVHYKLWFINEGGIELLLIYRGILPRCHVCKQALKNGKQLYDIVLDFNL